MTARSTEESIPVLLADVTRLFWRRLEAAYRRDGLDFTAGEARTLVNVSWAEGARQSVLAENMRIEPMTLVGFLDRLEARGLVARCPDPNDRRAKLVRTTPAAAEIVARILAIAAGVKAEVTAGMEPEELDRLRGTLQRIRANLDVIVPTRAGCAA